MSFQINRGESLQFDVSLCDIPQLATFTCNLKVAGLNGVSVVDRQISQLSEDNSKFIATITPSETSTLASESYYKVSFRLSSSILGIVKDLETFIFVRAS